jgi:hypothetical protein
LRSRDAPVMALLRANIAANAPPPAAVEARLLHSL